MVILEKAIQASNLPRPQSIQHRAKAPKSLKARLEESGKLDSENIESERRDLAGVRLIFYTNTDIERFLNSRVIVENFEIERDATRIHHPTAENKERRYRAIHYTVRMKEDRVKLPEYSRFNGMRCEIQIHHSESCVVGDLTRHCVQEQAERRVWHQGDGVNQQSPQPYHGQVPLACWL
jgi:ppGpp synthetase/RelA/SpoT-type nucleotidyltranferase